jgi:hydrogenase maturation protein HypF
MLTVWAAVGGCVVGQLMTESIGMIGKEIRIRGIVQGVGFRPAIWHLAHKHQLKGEVWNDGQGVAIHVVGDKPNIDAFIAQIPHQLPPLASVESIEVVTCQPKRHFNDFCIVASQHHHVDTAIPADAAICPDCLADITDPNNRRYRYPFTNCTHCGPRLSIVKTLPYDRQNTSMAAFTMCLQCQQEYESPYNRRFHAQANCCRDCGPNIWLEDHQRQTVHCTDPLRDAAELIKHGYILAIKGIGGFHLACDATDEKSVTRLRERKHRYAKPLALMATNLAVIARYASMSELEKKALQDKSAPIVLLSAQGIGLAPSVAPNNHKLGFILPYTPLHTLLMQYFETPIVLTSGNISDDAQCIENEDAREKLAHIADFFLFHERDIINRLDDAITQEIGGRMHVLRRGRGYAPDRMSLPPGFEHTHHVLAMGADLKNSICLIKNGQAIVSQHIGDLEKTSVQRDYHHTIAFYKKIYDCKPQIIANDYHLSYVSSQYGQCLAELADAIVIPVQHHHAHFAACLAEWHIPLSAPPMLAAIFDGLGLSCDQDLWGGEFLMGDYKTFKRLGYFQPIALPGGTQAIREPWRNTYAQLHYYFDFDTLLKDYEELAIIQQLTTKPLTILEKMIQQNINAPLSSSCGRWFDAFAAALNLHSEKIDYEGQAAIALEVIATPVFASEHSYLNAWTIEQNDTMFVLGWQGLWFAVLQDLKRGVDHARIAARIHHSLVNATVDVLNILSEKTKIDNIVLSGGVFQNRLILEAVSIKLQQCHKNVFYPQRFPMNDGGLALGQAVISAAISGEGLQ